MKNIEEILERLLAEQDFLKEMQGRIVENYDIMIQNQQLNADNHEVVIHNQATIIRNQEIIVNNQINIVRNQKQIVQNQVQLDSILQTQSYVLNLVRKLAVKAKRWKKQIYSSKIWSKRSVKASKQSRLMTHVRFKTCKVWVWATSFFQTLQVLSM